MKLSKGPHDGFVGGQRITHCSQHRPSDYLGPPEDLFANRLLVCDVGTAAMWAWNQLVEKSNVTAAPRICSSCFHVLYRYYHHKLNRRSLEMKRDMSLVKPRTKLPMATPHGYFTLPLAFQFPISSKQNAPYICQLQQIHPIDPICMPEKNVKSLCTLCLKRCLNYFKSITS